MSDKESLRTWMTQKAILTAEKYTMISNKSTFHKTGKLTPDEFVLAGDYLVSNFPSWKWQSGNKDMFRDYLPHDKQYLMCSDVPCHPPTNNDVSDNSCDWLDDNAPPEEPEEILELELLDISESEIKIDIPDKNHDSDDDDVESLDDFDYDDKTLIDNDPASLSKELESNFIKHKTYDMMITYDKYYSTPRVWFFGYDEDHIPLEKDEWHHDFSKEHLNKTVTFESHPHLPISCPTIHPCKHDVAMLKFITMALENKRKVDVSNYLVIFLKFIQSMVPNMEYDFTGTVDM